MDTFHYQPLSSATSIRILELSPAIKKATDLHGKLLEIDLESHRLLTYEAVSYVWGTDTKTSVISCDDDDDTTTIKITPNCELALRGLRHRFRPRRLWVDAVCINQDDVHERGQQVDIMDQIYLRARRVQVWLGEPDSEDIGLHMLRANIFITRWLFQPIWGDNIILRPLLKMLTAIICLPILVLADLTTMSTHLHDMTHTPWLTRVWTLQEITLARTATVHYGPLSCTWEAYSAAVADEYNRLALMFDANAAADDTVRVLGRYRAGLRDAVFFFASRDTAKARSESKSDKPSKAQARVRDDALNLLISSVRFTDATDPKDKAFGIYGVLRALGVVGLPRPEYDSTDTRRVYVDTAIAVFKAKKDTGLNLQHFWRVDSEVDSLGLPSWVPDWGGGGAVKKLWRFPRSLEPRPRNRADRSREFCACSDRVEGVVVFEREGEGEDGEALVVEGVIVDRVVVTGQAYPVTNADGWSRDREEAGVQAMLSWKDIALTTIEDDNDADRDTDSHNNAMHSLAEVMFRDTPLRPVFNDPTTTSFDGDKLAQWLDHGARGPIDKLFRYMPSEALNQSLSVEDFETIAPMWGGQKVVGTMGGRLAIVSEETGVEDVVALVVGCRLPLILRPCAGGGDDNGDCFNYVGPTYLPAAMFGGLWPVEGDEEVKRIRLV